MDGLFQPAYNIFRCARMIDGDEQAGLSMACDGYTAKVFSYIGFSILAMAMFGILLYCSCRTASFSDTKIKLEDYNALGDFFKNRIAATKKRSRIEVVTDELSLN